MMHTRTSSQSCIPATLLSAAILAGICSSGVWAIGACLNLFERIAGMGVSCRTATDALSLLLQ